MAFTHSSTHKKNSQYFFLISVRIIQNLELEFNKIFEFHEYFSPRQPARDPAASRSYLGKVSGIK